MHSELVIPGGSDEGESMGLIQPWVQLGFECQRRGTEFGKDSGPCCGEPTVSQRARHFPFAFNCACFSCACDLYRQARTN